MFQLSWNEKEKPLNVILCKFRKRERGLGGEGGGAISPLPRKKETATTTTATTQDNINNNNNKDQKNYQNSPLQLRRKMFLRSPASSCPKRKELERRRTKSQCSDMNIQNGHWQFSALLPYNGPLFFSISIIFLSSWSSFMVTKICLTSVHVRPEATDSRVSEFKNRLVQTCQKYSSKRSCTLFLQIIGSFVRFFLVFSTAQAHGMPLSLSGCDAK